MTTLVGTPHWMPEGARAVEYGGGRLTIVRSDVITSPVRDFFTP